MTTFEITITILMVIGVLLMAVSMCFIIKLLELMKRWQESIWQELRSIRVNVADTAEYTRNHIAPDVESIELLVACNTSMNRLKWISVEDSLPEDDECCLIYDDCGIDIGSYNSKTQYWLSEYSGQPTHWMPLPEPPKKGGEQ